MEFSFSELFGYFGSLLGTLMIFISIVFMKGNRYVHINLIFVLLICTLVVFIGTLGYSGKIQYFPYLIRIDSPLHFLFGPAVYLFTLSCLKSDFKYRKLHLLHFLPFVINLIQFLPFYLSPIEAKLNYYEDLMAGGSIIMPWYYLAKTITLCCYLIAEIYVFYKHLKIAPVNTINIKYHTSWFITFFIVQFFIYSTYIFDHLTGLVTFQDPYKFTMNMSALLLIVIAIMLLFFPQLLYGNIFENKDNHAKYSYSTLTEATKERLLSDWSNFINDDSKPYLNPKLSINDVAKSLHTNHRRLSQVINEKTGMNFNDNINSLRIMEAKRLLETGNFRNLTIDAVAQISGFNSKSPFYTAFKKHTGVTPKEYLKTLQEVKFL